MTDHNIALFLKFIGNLLGTYYDRDDDDCTVELLPGHQLGIGRPMFIDGLIVASLW